jgi:opacity protein-like surface antigen
MRLFYFITVIVFFNQLNAQQTVIPFKQFGFQAGAAFSNMNFNKGEPAPVVKIDPSWKAGFTFGLLMRVPLGNKGWLQPEYNYVQRKGTDKSIGTSYDLDYLSLPLLLHYKLCHRFSIYAGPQGELLVHATSNNNGVKTNITHDTEERSLAAVAGIECRVIQSFFLSARYLRGFNHIGIGQRSSVKEFKYEAVSIMAGIHF